MAITRIQAEKSLVKRAGKRMAFVGLDGTTITGANADLNEPLATALMRMDVMPDDITAVTDSDLSGVTGILELLDKAELRLLENIRGNMDLVDLSVGSVSESFSQFSRDLDEAIKSLREHITSEYGTGLGSLSAGTIGFDFQQKGDDTMLSEGGS